MKTIIRSPIKISKELIRSFYYLEFDQKKESNSGIVVDDACYELMFAKENNVNFINGDNDVFLIPPSFTLINPKSPFRFEFPETFSTFCIKIQPWMNASYVPTQEGKIINLNTIYPIGIDQLHQDIFKAESIEAKIDHAENFLSKLPITQNQDTDLIKNICLLIYERSGNISVNEIAEEFKIYRQKLNQLFKQEVKYTLKYFINCVRIRACLTYKFENPEKLLTEIAHLFGYFDQAHFIHSFKKACGISPSEYVNDPGYSLTSAPFQKGNYPF